MDLDLSTYNEPLDVRKSLYNVYDIYTDLQQLPQHETLKIIYENGSFTIHSLQLQFQEQSIMIARQYRPLVMLNPRNSFFSYHFNAMHLASIQSTQRSIKSQSEPPLSQHPVARLIVCISACVIMTVARPYRWVVIDTKRDKP